MFFEIYDLDLYGNGAIRLCVSFFIAEIINVEVELVCEVTPDVGSGIHVLRCEQSLRDKHLTEQIFLGCDKKMWYFL